MSSNRPSASPSRPPVRPHDREAGRPSRGGPPHGTEPNDPPEDRLAWSRGAFASPVGWPCAIDADVDAATDADEPLEVGTVEPAGRRRARSG